MLITSNEETNSLNYYKNEKKIRFFIGNIKKNFASLVKSVYWEVF